MLRYSTSSGAITHHNVDQTTPADGGVGEGYVSIMAVSMKRYRQVARLMGHAKAWVDWHNYRWGNGRSFAECSLGYTDIALVLGVSKSTARRVALAVEDMVDGAHIRWSRVTERKVLVMRLTKPIDPDTELADVYYDAYNAEFSRLENLYPTVVKYA